MEVEKMIFLRNSISQMFSSIVRLHFGIRLCSMCFFLLKMIIYLLVLFLKYFSVELFLQKNEPNKNILSNLVHSFECYAIMWLTLKILLFIQIISPLSLSINIHKVTHLEQFIMIEYILFHTRVATKKNQHNTHLSSYIYTGLR